MILKTLPRFDLTPELSGWRGGSGPAILLVHGVGLRAEAWSRMLPSLLEDHAVTAVDLPGHGKSRCMDADNPQLAHYTARLARLLDKFDHPPVIVGHSMGALLALDLAIGNPDKVSAIVPLNCIFRRSDAASLAVRKRAEALSDSIGMDHHPTLERWFGDDPQGDMLTASSECADWLGGIDPKGYRDAYMVFAREDGPSVESLKALECPALFVTGSLEPNSTPQMSRDLAGFVRFGTCTIIEGARHMMPMTHAGKVSRLVQDFCRKAVTDHG